MHTEETGRLSSKIIDVFILGQNQFFRQGLGTALSRERGFRVLGDADIQQEDAFEVARSVSAKVILLGLPEAPVAEIQLIHRLAMEIPGTSFIALTSNFSENELVQLIAAGVSAYLSKDIDADSLADTIRRVADGEFLITESLISEPSVLTRVLKYFRDMVTNGGRVELTDRPITAREAEVLTYVACGYGNKQIASILTVSEQTVKNHMASILRKLAASDRTHAVVKAMQNGWITASAGNDHGGHI